MNVNKLSIEKSMQLLGGKTVAVSRLLKLSHNHRHQARPFKYIADIDINMK